MRSQSLKILVLAVGLGACGPVQDGGWTPFRVHQATGEGFPTWMGVYGQFQRHDGRNPGTFTTLMNADRWGLQAEVSYRVNDGAWTTLAMAYVGNNDGNSTWSAQPAQPFPGSASVEFYFRGFDDAGNQIWDSNNGQNHRFQVAAASWSQRRLAWQGPDNVTGMAELDAVTVIFAQDAYRLTRDGGATWSDVTSCAVNGHTLTSVVTEANAVHLLYASTDGRHGTRSAAAPAGSTLALSTLAPLPVTSPTGLQLAAYQGDLFAAWTDVPPYGSGMMPLRFSRKLSGQSAWSAPVEITSAATSPSLAAAGSGVHVVFQGTEYRNAAYARSADRGATFQVLSGFSGTQGNNPGSYLRLTADDNQVYAVFNDFSPPDNSKLYVLARHKNAQSWEAARFVHQHVSYKATAVVDAVGATDRRVDVVGHVYGWYGGSGNPFHAASDNGGQGFQLVPFLGASRVALHPSLTHASAASLGNEGGGVGIYFSRFQAPGYAPTQPVAWVGNTRHWPPAGQLDHYDDFWVDAEVYPRSSAAQVRVRYTLDNGPQQVEAMVFNQYAGNNDAYHTCLGRVPPGAVLRYQVETVDGSGTVRKDDNNGQWYQVRANGGDPLTWVGNTRHWPPNGSIDNEQDVFVNAESHPRGSARTIVVKYRAGSGAWQTRPMLFEGEVGNNDAWYVNLGRFAPDTVVQYTVEATDAGGSLVTSSNGGSPFEARLNPPDVLTWVGNAVLYPNDRPVYPGDTLWFEVQTYPQNAAKTARVLHKLGNGATQEVALSGPYPEGNNDRWNATIQAPSQGGDLAVSFEATDEAGGTRRDDNGGSWHHVTIVTSACGDGAKRADEACDDGNTVGGDGCSATCQSVEPGALCIGEQPSRCFMDRGAGSSLAPTSAPGLSHLGNAVAVSGSYAVVGAEASDGARGAAYVFQKQSGSWLFSQALARSPQAGDWYGATVAVNGSYAAVRGGEVVDVFERNTQGAWNRVAALASPASEGCDFGRAMVIDGTTLAVSGPSYNESRGAVFLYTRANNTWSLSATITRPQAPTRTRFGASLALSGGTLVVGDPQADVNDDDEWNDTGRAYVYTRGSNGAWTQSQVVVPAGALGSSYVGNAVALAGNTLFVSSRAVDRGWPEPGIVHVYERTSSTSPFNPRQELMSPAQEWGDGFSASLAASGSRLVVGCPSAHTGEDSSGGAHVFARQPDGTWSFLAQLRPSPAVNGGYLGNAVATDGTSFVVGGPGSGDAVGFSAAWTF
jgi:cysteine-rich repeat protein